MSKPVLTIAETAALFGTTQRKTRRAIRDGQFEVIKVGRTTFVLREPLERRLMVNLQEHPGEPEPDQTRPEGGM